MNPILTTHSGANRQEENSKEYLESCIGSGAQYVEVDIQKTKDNILILSHDSKINSNPIIERTYSQLIKIKPSLLQIKDVYNFSKKTNFKINFDLKTIDAAEHLVQSIEENMFISNCIISGCHLKEIELIKNNNKEVRVLYNLEKEDLNSLEYIFNKLVDLKVYGVNLNYHLCSQYLFDSLNKYKLPAFVWTVDTIEDFNNCKKYKISSITTNYPSLFHTVYNNNK